MQKYILSQGSEEFLSSLGPDSLLAKRFRLHQSILEVKNLEEVSEYLQRLEGVVHELKNENSGIFSATGSLENDQEQQYYFLSKKVLLFKAYMLILDKLLSSK